MSKLKLVANPTFQAAVPIPVAGGEDVKVLMTFKHRTTAALEEFIKTREGKTDTETFMDMVTAWDLEDEFNKDNVELLTQNYAGAAIATFTSYIDELFKAKVKN